MSRLLSDTLSDSFNYSAVLSLLFSLVVIFLLIKLTDVLLSSELSWNQLCRLDFVLPLTTVVLLW